jgi:hypothetical protein
MILSAYEICGLGADQDFDLEQLDVAQAEDSDTDESDEDMEE